MRVPPASLLILIDEQSTLILGTSDICHSNPLLFSAEIVLDTVVWYQINSEVYARVSISALVKGILVITRLLKSLELSWNVWIR